MREPPVGAARPSSPFVENPPTDATMSIEVEFFDSDGDEWNDLVDRSSQGSLFHRHEFLNVVENNCDGDLHRLVGYKGNEPVGLFPLYDLTKAGLTAAFSPPPRMGIGFQGPILLNHEKLSQRKFERRHRRFITGCVERIEDEVDPRYYRFLTTSRYDDPRPLAWNDFEITPQYTYILDISGETDELKKSFSKSLRRYLDPDDLDRIDIEEEGIEGIRFIYEQISARYEAQGRTYSVPLEYLIELYRDLPDGHVRPYVGRVDGDRAGGIIILEDDDTVYFSEGGGKPDVDVPVNDILHWEIIKDSKRRDVRYYDLYGANIPRLCKYKAKFNPEMVTYFEAERSRPLMKVLSKAYRVLR